MDREKQEAILEAVLFTMGESVELGKLAEVIGESKEDTKEILSEMKEKLNQSNRGISLMELEDSFQLCTKSEMYEYLIKIAKSPRKYVLTEEERDEYVASLQERNVKFEIARMKGLGEMDAEELNETTMDIEKRVLRKITVEDARLADEVFSELMGDEVELRRKFIEENAKFVKNLDI